MSALPLTAALVSAVLLSGCASDAGDGRTVTNQAPNRSAARSLEPTPAPPSVAASASADSLGNITFAGVTVTNALNPDVEPEVTVENAAPAPGLLVEDLITGTGQAASPTSTVTVHYKGVLYADGTEFDSNYGVDKPDAQALGKTIAGFAQGIGGTDGVTPMKVGGRRVVVFPAALGYGAVPVGKIPAHASLVFVIDLLDVS